jgi:hypothetical protein
MSSADRDAYDRRPNYCSDSNSNYASDRHSNACTNSSTAHTSANGCSDIVSNAGTNGRSNEVADVSADVVANKHPDYNSSDGYPADWHSNSFANNPLNGGANKTYYTEADGSADADANFNTDSSPDV